MYAVRATHLLIVGLLMVATVQAQQPGPSPGRPQPFAALAPAYPPPAQQAVFHAPPFGPPGQVQQAAYNQGPMPGPMVQQVGYEYGMGGGGGIMGGGMGGCGMGGCGMGGCGMGGCGPGCGKGAPCACLHAFHVEAEAAVLLPSISGNFASGSMASTAVPFNTVFNSEDAEIEDDVFMAPRIILHATSGHWGLATRFWYLGMSDVEVTPLDLLTLNILGQYSEERVQSWTGDVEATYTWHLNYCHVHPVSWSFQTSVGVRYAEFEHDAVSVGSAVMGNALATTGAIAHTYFDGVGVTGGFRGQRVLWPSVLLHYNAELAFVWSLRGSIVRGDLESTAMTSATLLGTATGATSINSAGATDDTDLNIGEIQVGFQWQQNLQCMPARWFVRVAAEFQHWDFDSELGAISNSTVQIAVDPPPEVAQAIADAHATSPEVDLVGISIAGGLIW